MADDLFGTEEHSIFRETVRRFVQEELAPRAREFDKMGMIDKSVYPKMGELGLLGIRYDPKYGGAGLDYSFSAIFFEEIARCDNAGVAMGITVHTDMATPAIHQFGSEDLKQRFLVPAIKGELVAAIAVTEPGAGSDVAGIKTRAVKDGDDWVINGSKMFITNSAVADFISVLCVTNPDGGYNGYTLIVVPTDSKGFSYRLIDKIGNKGSDTGELVFEDVRVPRWYTVGEEGRGFQQQMIQFQDERLVAAVMAPAGARRLFDITKEYCEDRVAFGKPLSKMQVTRHKFAEMLTQITAARELAYHCVRKRMRGEEATLEISMAKLFGAEVARFVADTCVQLHGGYGYCTEYAAGRAFVDTRLLSIGGGTDEIMRQIIAKMIGL